jgi:integrase
MRFTKRSIDALVAPDPSGRQTLYWSEDRAMLGLGIVVSGVSPSKSWICQGNVNGKAVRITLGPVAQLTIDEAWEMARPKLAAMLQGSNPKLGVVRRQLSNMTVGEVFEEYLTASPNLKPATVGHYRSSSKHLGPLLSRVMREISADEVERQFRHITSDVVARREAGKIRGGANVQGKGIANSAMRLFGSLWEFQAERDSGMPANPVRGRRLRKRFHKLERRTRLIPSDHLGEFYKATLNLPSKTQRDVVLIGLFTGMREREVSGLRWSEVDLVNKMLHLPAGRMKGKKAFDLPMSDLVHQILVARRAPGREGEHVFSSSYSKSGHCESFTYALGQISNAIGIRLSPHDLRRTFASEAANLPKIPPIALKMLIAHSTGTDVTSGYTILSQAQLREAAQVVANKFKELCAIPEPQGDNVVPLQA